MFQLIGCVYILDLSMVKPLKFVENNRVWLMVNMKELKKIIVLFLLNWKLSSILI